VRFHRPHDQEDEAARLLRRSSGSVAVWSDGSVSWFKSSAVVIHSTDTPIYLPCPMSDGPARRAYTAAIREWFNRERQETT
jgi:hypothetical protein